MALTTLRYDMSDGVGWITLDQPQSMNALHVAMASELRETLGRVKDDSQVRVLVLTGSGRGFCAGGDVAAFHENLDEAHKYIRELVLRFHSAIATMLDLKIPVIGGINGVVAGAGMGLCMATDLAIAAESARFTMAYTGIGAAPDGGTTFFLPRLVGAHRAMEMMLTNRRIDAAEALEWGLVNKVVPDDQLEGEVRELAGQLAAGPTAAYAMARRLVRESLYNSVATQLENEANSIVASAQTADFREGVAAFIEKRKPRFAGV